MKNLLSILFISFFIIISCTKKKSNDSEKEVKASERITLEDKGVGPIRHLNLAAEVDTEMAERGRELYNSNCVACHKVSEDFIGPTPKGILQRRSPEWVMNMILNPEEMVHTNKVANELMEEYDLVPMANLSLSEEQARDILEYFRTLN